MKESVFNELAVSMCTARLARHVNSVKHLSVLVEVEETEVINSPVREGRGGCYS